MFPCQYRGPHKSVRYATVSCVFLHDFRRFASPINRVPRRVFGPKWDEGTGECRKLPNEELNDLYCSPNIVRVIKSRRMRLARHVARMGERRGEERRIQSFDGET